MFHKILVAIDSSESSHIVFNEALALVKATGSRIMLLHVLSSEEEGSPDMSMVGVEYYPTIANDIAEMHRKQWAAYDERGLEMLRSYAKQAAAADVTVEFTQNLGNPGRTICGVAHTWDADLIIMGRRGHSGLSQLLLGSVSNYVLHHAPCSVLTVQRSIHIDSTSVQDQQTVAVS
jgi:nucleotide-binding universal stress UspA family protein